MSFSLNPLKTPTGEDDEAALELAFSKKKADDRKQWLASFVPGTFLDQSVDQISYSEFVNKARARPLHNRAQHCSMAVSPAHGKSRNAWLGRWLGAEANCKVLTEG